ncbi:putative phosphothreonine lyase domain-containing protein [Halosegnis longus]|uniref:putative phosphothreonine lyase domain-containing protein n=1 Tax=Halosegnis longus TaxID=2216012 RepID=UPI00096A822B|nr:putative phosphothreonine lyase domain-containg protein [Salella cibi]
MQSPSTITADETYWLRASAVTDADTATDAYFEDHDVLRPAETTKTDLPPTDDEAVARIDRDALGEEKFIGKWQVTGSADRIDALWPDIVASVESQTIWAAKAMTGFGFDALEMYDEYVLAVYTPNYVDTDDVYRVREHLREAHGVTEPCYYKPDIYTANGIVADNVDEFGLEKPARYVE